MAFLQLISSLFTIFKIFSAMRARLRLLLSAGLQLPALGWQWRFVVCSITERLVGWPVVAERALFCFFFVILFVIVIVWQIWPIFVALCHLFDLVFLCGFL